MKNQQKPQNSIELLKVVLEKETHTYYKEGDDMKVYPVNNIIPVSSVLGILFPNKLQGAPEHLVKAAGLKGNLVHSEVEEFFRDGKIGFTDEIEAFIKATKDFQHDGVITEKCVGMIIDGISIGGTLDLYFPNEKYLMDIKTTYSVDKPWCKAQLSFYATMLELEGLQVDKIGVMWLRGEKSELIELERIETDGIFELIAKYKNGEALVLTENITPAISQDKIEFLIEYEQKTKEEKAKYDKYRKELYHYMIDNGIEKAELIGSSILTISKVEPTTKKVFDSKLLELENPEIYKKYLGTSDVSGYVKINIKKNKELK